METEEKISVIIPVYNVGKYLYDCLRSVCGQTYKNLEIILIDDGSTDESGCICDEWGIKDHRIRVIHKPNGGVSTARNMGLKAATGDFIGFVDSDDWIEPQMYEKLIEGIGDADMACCGYVDYPLGTLELPIFKGVKTHPICNSIEAAMHIYERDGYFTAIWNKLYRRQVIIKSGKYIMMDHAISWGEDEVWLAQVLMNSKKISFVSDALYHWRPTEVSATRNNSVTDRQMTLLAAKLRAMKILPQSVCLQNLMKARMFNDCYSLKVLAYASQDWEKFRTISVTLKQMEHIWMNSKDSSFIRKVKVRIMEMEMNLGMPGKWVLMINDISRYGIKRQKTH